MESGAAATYILLPIYTILLILAKKDRLDLKSWYDIHVPLYLEDWTLVCALWIFMSSFVLLEKK